jgi:hypothetical protein
MKAMSAVYRELWELAIAEREALRRELEAERHRAGLMAIAATTPCLQCEVLSDDLADALDERDKWQQAAQFMERIGFSPMTWTP